MLNEYKFHWHQVNALEINMLDDSEFNKRKGIKKYVSFIR